MPTQDLITGPTLLSDDELTSAVRRLAGSQRETTVTLVAHLMEFDARRLFLPAGCASTFVYCTAVLRLSEHEAYHRIEAARLVRKFPLVLEMLAEGTLTLTTARLLSQHLTADNQSSLLAEAAGRSKREVVKILARMFPLPLVPTSIRKVPVRQVRRTDVLSGEGVDAAARADASPSAPRTEADGSLLGGFPAPTPQSPPVSNEAADVPAQAERHALVRPLTGDLYELRVTLPAETREKLREATDLLRHSVPGGDTAAVIDLALTALLGDLRRRKFADTPRPRSGRGVSGTTLSAGDEKHGRYIPAQVKRAVWSRDEARCAFVGTAGRRCSESGFVEFHHVRPFGVGGDATEENIELRCRAHNAYEAEVFYGERWRPATDRPDRDISTRSGPS